MKGPAMSSTAKKREQNYVKDAECHFPNAYRIDGEGPYAVVTACRPGGVIVSLHAMEERAQEVFDQLSRRPCGGRCYPEMRHAWHRLMDVREKVVSWPPEGHGNPSRFAHCHDRPTTNNEGGPLKFTLLTARQMFDKYGRGKGQL